MSKKDKDTKRGKPGQGRSLVFQDLTAERHFQSQMAKALKLGQDKRYSEALEILEILEEKYPTRAEMFELLGVVHYSLQEFDDAREAFARALDLDPAEKRTGRSRANGPLIQFNLASSYAMSGFPLLAYETMQQVNCNTLEDIPGNRLDPATCRDFSRVCDENVTSMAEKEGLPREKFLPYGLAMEKGHLALPRYQTALARLFFQEAIELRPDNLEPYRGLSAAYTLDGQPDQARQQLEYILEKIDPQNLQVISALVRMLVTQEWLEDAREYVSKLDALPLPEELEERVSLALTWAYLDEDQHIFEIIEPLLNSPVLRKRLIDADEEEDSLDLFGEALLLGVVAAAHLGQQEQALTWLREEADEELVGEENFYFPLLQRTWQALENNETGPRRDGRFFYFNPQTILTTAMLGQKSLLDLVQKIDIDPEVEGSYLEMIEKKRILFMEVLLHDVWTGRDVESLTPALEMILELENRETPDGEPEESATLRRLTFTRAGDVLLHLTSLALLIQHGIVSGNEPHTIWLADHQITGTIEELSSQAIEWSEQQEAAEAAAESDETED